MENQGLNNSKKKKPIALIIVAAVLLLGVIGLVILYLTTKSNYDVLLEEKEMQKTELVKELDSLMVEHEKVKTDFGVLSDSLGVKDSIIQANADEIKKLLDTQWEYYKIKKKLANLQTIAQGYVVQMDSLYRVNSALTQQNHELEKNVKQLKQENQDIQKDRDSLNEMVEIASELKAYNLEATGIRMKTGGSKEVPTDKAKRMDKIKICFTIGENEIIKPGERELYVRIARPDKEILTPSRADDYTFEYEGNMIQYSIRKTINYSNLPMDVCGYWNKRQSIQNMPTGLYHVDIFCDGLVIGHTTFTLK